jgi:hypothetical protein
MFAHYANGEEEMYDEHADPYETANLAADPAYQTEHDQLLQKAQAICSTPPGFSWSP